MSEVPEVERQDTVVRQTIKDRIDTAVKAVEYAHSLLLDSGRAGMAGSSVAILAKLDALRKAIDSDDDPTKGVLTRRGQGGYEEGDTFSYLSTSSMTVVTWTRDDQGAWTCDDGRSGTATDADVADQRAHSDEED